MTIHVTGTIFTSEGLETIAETIDRDNKVFPLGPELQILVGDEDWGMWWIKNASGVHVRLDESGISGRHSTAVGAHTMKAHAEGGGSIEARWSVV